uniref:AsIV-cont00151-ORF1 n=1 Tax=Apophua simplicipes ichnovirus TaxID=1329648 RepID=S5DRE3_9VIRU|nr:AsIV-cont00151-ORF1 [Apophua simplicipes ichnovirus]
MLSRAELNLLNDFSCRELTIFQELRYKLRKSQVESGCVVSRKMHCVVDVHGFKQSDEKFVLKEFAMVTIGVKTVKHLEFVVKPPYPFEYLLKEHRAANLYLTRNVHGISWDSGTISYEESRPYIRKLLKNARTIYVRGSEKRVWLCSLLNFSVQIVDLMKLDYPRD